MNNNAYNHPHYRNFVRPELCLLICQHGISKNTGYAWKERAGKVTLHTHVFDIDAYYQDAVKMIDNIDPPVAIAPAYTIADIMLMLQAIGLHWRVTSEGNEFYFAPINKRYHDVFLISHNPRMPDLLAKVLITLLDKAHVDITNINEVLKLENYSPCVS